MSEQVKPDGAGGSPNTTVKQPWENLGFESFDAYSQAQVAEVEKLRKQAEEKQAMIDRQANELGQLRKAVPPNQQPTETPPQNTPPPNMPEDDGMTKEAERTLRELKITMPEDQKQKVQEALSAAEPEIIEIVKKDPRSRLVFMKKVLGEQFSLPKPKVDIFDGIGPAPERKPLHEQLQELLNQQNSPSPNRPFASHTVPRAPTSTNQENPLPVSKRVSRTGGIVAALKQLEGATA